MFFKNSLPKIDIGYFIDDKKTYFAIYEPTNSLYRLVKVRGLYFWQFVDNYLTLGITTAHFGKEFSRPIEAVFAKEDEGCEIYEFQDENTIKSFLKKHSEVAKIAREYEKRRNAEPAVIFN